MKAIRKSPLALTLAFLLLTSSAFAQSGSAMKLVLKDPLAWGLAIAVFMMLIALAALNRALNTVRTLATAKMAPAAAKVVKPNPLAETSLLQAITGTKPIEDEADILLDHNYDGIHELDNDLPPWWIWGFYITIAWAIIYTIFFFGTGTIPNSSDEYAAEMAAEQTKVEAYLAAAGEAVDESNVVLLITDTDLMAGAKIFADNCVACHLSDGGGLIGPNLTDKYWIHGGGIADLFTTIKYGVPAKGMISWEDQLGPKEMQQVASYILSLQGTTPANPKAAEGDLWEESPAEASPEATPAEGETSTENSSETTPENT